jgi:polar amino acid transport system substrate-binding protein
VAKQLGFAKGEVRWIVVPFNTSFAPGAKKFDFDINQISFKPVRAKAVSFSDSYYNVNQALVVVKGTPIANTKSIAALKPYKLGAQLGTTSYDYIVNTIKPS